MTAAKLVHVGSGKSFDCTKAVGGVEFVLPDDFKSDAHADVFRIVRCALRRH